ncbi:phospholipase A [Halomonas sp. NO4]|uniref:phospholipase A n=1 Tax=Halomonas sp. NO4 TaxID=2484813 RepID=UPI0013D51ACE|nr:phospholipase A [Halomonas sp. NO4]
MSPVRPALLVALLLATTGAALAAEPGTEANRAAIEARIEALNAELTELQRQLETLPEENGGALDREEEATREEIAQRRQLERESTRNPLAITSHRRNYLLPLSYSHDPETQNFAAVTNGNSPKDFEVKYQFSVKVNMVEDLFGDKGDLYFAYTQRSWWQAYNADSSSPFRETNYEPEVFLSFDNAWRLFGWTNSRNRIAFNHQSNGQSGELSRSWNRFYLESLFRRGDWALNLAPHWRVPESSSDDDNPDIHRYMGYGDITLARRLEGDAEASLMVRGNPGAGHMGAQVDYSWPLFGNIRGHVQYYYGYGESLIDYDYRNQRLSLGFSINPLFSGSGSAQ